MSVVFESKYAVLDVDHARRFVRYTRTDVPFEAIADVTATFTAIGAATAGIDRARYVMLSDVRNAHGRNDPAFENAVADFRARLFGGFARRATLVRTMAGELQVKRLNKEQHVSELRVFHDEREALTYLLGG